MFSQIRIKSLITQLPGVPLCSVVGVVFIHDHMLKRAVLLRANDAEDECI